MASGSVISQQVSKAAEDFTGTFSCASSSRTVVAPEDISYSVQTGYTGILAGFSCETDLTVTPMTPITAVMTSVETTIVGIRNNASSNYTRHICLYATFVKSGFVDDQR